MNQIDLDDLPPRTARILNGLQPGETLMLVQAGGVVARLTVEAVPAPSPVPIDLPPGEAMAEVMDQFKAMIEDEF